MFNPAHESILTLKLIALSSVLPNLRATAGNPLSMVIGMGRDLLSGVVLNHTDFTTNAEGFLGKSV